MGSLPIQSAPVQRSRSMRAAEPAGGVGAASWSTLTPQPFAAIEASTMFNPWQTPWPFAADSGVEPAWAGAFGIPFAGADAT
ncbi:hypothetical protein QO010_000230 [Caulobacter ginsengisoli]|uniref:Uncharacterized protein n=1 Tax=Caulobacter ginsengisoli TaxID=400775 RepID=A0ABU0INE6_9CAUL|nr:hypothetical protein [Caulobacter ginsengisoli]MDQ0462482.1 hypothetical protein [Caulobacter ginsengisoli]